MEKELKFHVPNGKSYTVIEVKGEYLLKKNRDINVMINNNRNKRYISDEKAELIKDKLLGASNNSLYHLVFFDKAKHKGLNMDKPLIKIEVVE